MPDRNEEKKITFLLFLCAFIIRLSILFVSDDTDRSGSALSAILTPSWSIVNFITHHTPPLGIYFVKIARLFNESPMAARIPTFILGSLLIIPFYYLFKILYNQEIAFFSSLALVIFYKHINLSVTSSVEVYAYFFVFTALYFFFKFKQAGNKKLTFLMLSASALNFATMSRYETWLLIPILTFFLIKQNKKYLFSFFLIAIIFPAFWMYLNYKFLGSPISFYLDSAKAVKEEIIFGVGLGPKLSFFGKILGWFKILEDIFFYPLFWLGLFGLFWSVFKRKLALPFIFLCILAFFIFKVFNLTLFLDPRYAVFLALFFIPFIFFALDIFGKARKIVCYCLILSLSILWIQQTIYERPLFLESQAAILSYLKKNLQGNEQVLVVGSLDEILSKYLVSRNFSVRIYHFNERFKQQTEKGEREVDFAWLQNFAYLNNKPSYIVMDNTDTNMSLPDIKEILYFFPGAKPECVLVKNKGNIYKIIYE